MLGAGLAGLAAARDLAARRRGRHRARGARRVGGRVEQLRIDDGRPVQLGGEVVGPFHTAYLGLVEELGLTLQPSYTGVAGLTTYDLLEGVVRAEDWPFATAEERADYERVERLYGALVGDGRSRRPVVASRGGAARRRLGRRLAPLGRRAARR